MTTELSRRRRLKHAILRSRIPLRGVVARGYLRAVELYRTIRGARERSSAMNGSLAIPSARLRVLVAGTATVDCFLTSGRVQAEYLRELLAGVGKPIEETDAILDFGCGCGRISRWFSDLAGPQLSGCDYNRELVTWCQAHLRFMDTQATRLHPPLPYPDNSFDFVYAYSVFTHLSVELAARWMSELRRIVKPGGLMWFTIHGESYRERLLPEEKVRFDEGEIVVWLPEAQGTNICGAYWPNAAVERMLGDGFATLTHLDPQVDKSTAEKAHLQHDAYLVRRL
jgi:SAM-dependent methyltransferase